jgi:hypothetical protein
MLSWEAFVQIRACGLQTMSFEMARESVGEDRSSMQQQPHVADWVFVTFI